MAESNITIAVKAKTTQAVNALRDLGKAAQTNAEKLKMVGQSMSSAGQMMTVGITLPIVAAGAALISMGANLEEAQNLVRESFGDMAGAAEEWANALSDSLGLNRYELQESAAMLNVMMVSMGLAKEEAFRMSTSLIELAHDMASFYNLPFEDALLKLQAGLTGEAEPLKRLGILVNDTTIKTWAWTNGLVAQGEKLNEQQKVLARYGAIMDATKNAQGDLERTSTSFTNSMRRLGSQIKETAARLGQELIPIIMSFFLPAMEKAVNVLMFLSKAFAESSQPIKLMIIAFFALLAAIGPIVTVAGLLLTILPSLVAGITMVAAAFTTSSVTAVTATGSLATYGAMAATTTTTVKGLGLVIGGVLLQALLAVGVAIAAYKITEWAMEWSGLRKHVDAAYGAVWKFLSVSIDTEPQIRMMAEASEIAGRKVTDWSEAIAIMNVRILQLREENRAAYVEVEGFTEAIERASEEVITGAEMMTIYNAAVEDNHKILAQQPEVADYFRSIGVVMTSTAEATVKYTKSLAEEIKETQKATKEAKIMKEAKKLLGRGAENLAEAQKAVNLATSQSTKEMTAAQKKVESLAESLGVSGLEGELGELNTAYETLLASGNRLTTDGFDKIAKAMQEARENGLELTGAMKDLHDAYFDLEQINRTVSEAVKDSGDSWQDFGDDVSYADDGVVGIGESISKNLPRMEKLKHEQASLNDAFGAGVMVMGDIGNALSIVGINIDSAIGKVTRLISTFESLLGSISGIIGMLSGGGGLGDLLGGLLGGGGEGGGLPSIGSFMPEMTGGVGAEGAVASGASAVMGGISTALAAIPVAGWVALAGIGVGLLARKIFGAKEWEKAMEDIGTEWGIKISQGLAEEISKIADELDLTKLQAGMLKLGDIIAEQGGLSAENLEGISTAFGDLLQGVADGSLPAAEGMEAINDAFFKMVEGLEDMGMKGSVAMGGLITQMKELGVVTEEVQAFIEQKAASAVENLGKYFEYLLAQETLTAEQGTAAVMQMAGAFTAAVQATGSLVGAIAMLGPSFGELLKKVREVVGEENKVLNTITQYYNFISSNQEQLSAIEALGNAFKDLIELGIINAGNIKEYGASFRAEFESMLASTENKKMALMSIGPQIGMLLEAYKEMGVKVPPWLQAIADQAVEAGANMEPPEGLSDIMADIRDILLEIAGAFGVAGGAAQNFTTDLNNIPSSVDVDITQHYRTEGSKGGDGIEAQTGFYSRSLPSDLLIQAHRGEAVSIIPAGHISAQPITTSGGASTQPQPIILHNYMVLDGKVIDKKIIRTVNKAGRLGDIVLGDVQADPRA